MPVAHASYTSASPRYPDTRKAPIRVSSQYATTTTATATAAAKTTSLIESQQ
jgi:hypothetical protein